MNKRDVIIGLVILVVLLALFFWLRRSKPQSLGVLPTPSITRKIEDSFRLTIPSGVDKAELKDVSSGNGSGIATRKFENGVFDFTILADLPDAAPGTFYQGWLMKGNNFVSVGQLRIAKGGFLLDFQSNKDYSDYKGVVVTLEKVSDNNPEKHILEGSF